MPRSKKRILQLQKNASIACQSLKSTIDVSDDKMFEENAIMDEEDVETIISNSFEKIMDQMNKTQIINKKRPLSATGTIPITNFFKLEDLESGEEDDKDDDQSNYNQDCQDEDDQDIDDDNNEINQRRIYIDGYERSDVVAYRNEFLKQMGEFDLLMPKWLDKECKVKTLPNLRQDQRPHILVTHDEVGSSLHISDFLTEEIGRLKDNEGEARVIIALGANHDGYWNSERLLDQVHNAIIIFERTHPGTIRIWAFDNAMVHMAMAPDALKANKMNLNPKGHQPKMHPTTWDGNVQSLVIPSDYPDVNLRGQAKGMKKVLQECGLWRDGLMADCKNGHTEEELENRGHKVIFYPKFHSELNYIEMYWDGAKTYARKHCNCTWAGLLRTAPVALDSVPVEQIRAYARLSFW
ncbi:hypothetical protein C2G38_2155049 [Gigaspora rosea]|uniref:Uncharacterized protein n=1 Tax=Gigaspora rosea TaxID=44941 RepID=A0A397W4G0_9GLOM|nr:hypothetical protein C2G38_2155049 [Gigaspora rosea]